MKDVVDVETIHRINIPNIQQIMKHMTKIVCLDYCQEIFLYDLDTWN